MKNPTLNSSDPKIINGMLAGLVASTISSLFIAMAILITFGHKNFTIVTFSDSILAARTIAELILYFGVGTFIWGILYSLIERHIGGTPCNKGLLFGVLIWLIIMLMIIPLKEAHLFSDKDSPGAVIFTLILDLIFGVTLSITYSKLNK